MSSPLLAFTNLIYSFLILFFFFFEDDVVLLASSHQDLQLNWDSLQPNVKQLG